MDFLLLLRAVFALAVTLGLIGLAAVALRKYGPETIARMSILKRERRLTLIESLPLDPARRLVLVSLDGQERLILLGEGHLLPEPNAAKKRKVSTTSLGEPAA